VELSNNMPLGNDAVIPDEDWCKQVKDFILKD